jgi:hypothetical protein
MFKVSPASLQTFTDDQAGQETHTNAIYYP